MTVLLAKLIWGLGVVGWYAIRYRHERRSRRTARLSRFDRKRGTVLLAISICGILMLPLNYALTDQPKFAAYPAGARLARRGDVCARALAILLHGS